MKSKSFRLTDEATKELQRLATFLEFSEARIINLLLTEPAIVNETPIDITAAEQVLIQHFKRKSYTREVIDTEE